ncbi:MAG: aromatic amino acid lyase [Deltaproteobacteria bacterium]|nr:aromatic amino acid lyase [Deltaproteobacteria bacterium]
MDYLEIDGNNLEVSNIIDVARHRRRVKLSKKAIELTARCRAVVDMLVSHNVPVYGLTTGFGSKRNVFIDREDTKKLQHNLIRSHASGIGKPLPEDVVRAALLLRANALAKGQSGLRTIVLEKLLEILNKDIFPWVPDQGSVSASGDLAPLSHLALVLVGDPGGKIYDPSYKVKCSRPGSYVEYPDNEGFISSERGNLKSLFGYSAIDLEAKEGLALTNGVQVTCAMGMMNVYDASLLAKHADISAALSLEAIKGIPSAFDERLGLARPYKGQIESASNIREMVKNSSILSIPLNLAMIRKAVVTLTESMETLPVEDEIASIVHNVIKELEGVRNKPHSLISGDLKDFSSQLRQGLLPMQTSIQSIIRKLMNLETQSDIHLTLRENLVIVADLLEKAVPKIASVQDDYSFRCASQVHGAVRNTINHAIELLTIESNSATDNPLIFPPQGPEDPEEYKKSLTVENCTSAVISGGNFHGEPIALAMDYLTMAMSELGSISERRTAKIVDGGHNNGLPSLLIDKSGLNSGFMIPQYTGAALVSENKSMCFPASVDSIPTCENTEDHVSMGLIAARKTRTVIENVEKIIAIELLTSFQGLHFRAPFNRELGEGNQIVFSLMEQTKGIEFVSEDRILAPLISTVLSLVKSMEIINDLSTSVSLK